MITYSRVAPYKMLARSGVCLSEVVLVRKMINSLKGVKIEVTHRVRAKSSFIL